MQEEYVDPRDIYRTRYKQMYMKCYKFPEADVPLFFWAVILNDSAKSRRSKCLESNLERLYDSFSNKKTFKKYIQTLLDADAMLRIGRYNYMINPEYAHRGSHTSTETAKENYEKEKQAQLATGGKTPWVHGDDFQSVNESIAQMVKDITERD